ncbi:MAG: alpha/beta fold hydrolase [Polyangiales bacterium]
MSVQHVTLHGYDIAFRAEGSGPALVLLHGMAGSSATWRHVMPALARDFTLIAPDLLGHGESGKPKTDYSLGALASIVRDLLVALGHDRATIVGQSYGGGVAMQLAYQFPERCDRLVLVGSGGLGVEVNAILRVLSIPGAEFSLPIGVRPGIRDFITKACGWMERLGRTPSPAAVEIFSAYASLTDPDARAAFVLTLRSVVDHHGQCVSARERLYLTMDLPTLIVWGDADPIIPIQHGLDAHAAIRGSQLEIFEGVGHFPHCEAPERFVRVLTDFIRTTAAATSITPERWRELLTRPLSA